MAEQWKNNDSARTMTKKYNDVATQLNNLAHVTNQINECYITTIPSDFVIIPEQEEEDGKLTQMGT